MNPTPWLAPLTGVLLAGILVSGVKRMSPAGSRSRRRRWARPPRPTGSSRQGSSPPRSRSTRPNGPHEPRWATSATKRTPRGRSAAVMSGWATSRRRSWPGRPPVRLDANRDDQGFEGYDWLLIGQAQLHLDRPEEGGRVSRPALPLLSQAIDRDHEADARLLLAYALTERGEPASALKHLERGLELAALWTPLSVRPPSSPRWVEPTWPAVHPDLLPSGSARPVRRILALGDEGKAAAIDRVLGEALLALDLPEAALARVEMAAEATGDSRNPRSWPTTFCSSRESGSTRATSRRPATSPAALRSAYRDRRGLHGRDRVRWSPCAHPEPRQRLGRAPPRRSARLSNWSASRASRPTRCVS